jgi:phage/plasmid-associated DNA primase
MGVGHYSKEIPSNLLTRPLNNAHQANSAMCDLAESRIVTFNEPDLQEEFIASNVKSVTGNDGNCARRLHKEAKITQVKCIIICGMNCVLSFKDPDDACKSRVRIIPFITRWSNNAPKDENEQIKERHYKIDYDFDKNLDKLNDELLNLMVQYYPIWFKERLTDIPVAVKEATSTYWGDTDFYETWANESFKKVPNTTAEYSLNTTYQDFVVFFMKGNPKKTAPDMKTYRYHMSQKLGCRYYGKKWKDWEYVPTKNIQQ